MRPKTIWPGLEKGYKVAICEQIGETSKARGLVKGKYAGYYSRTVVEEDLTKEHNNYLAAITQEEGSFGLALWISPPAKYRPIISRIMRKAGQERGFDQLYQLNQPKSLLKIDPQDSLAKLYIKKQKNFTFVNKKILDLNDEKEALEILEKQLSDGLLQKSGLKDCQPALLAVALALKYILKMQRGSLAHIHDLKLHKPADALFLDAITIRNLEIFEALYSGEKEFPLGVLNRTKTAMGPDLRKWLERPLLEKL